MSSLIGGIFDLFGGNPAGAEQQQFGDLSKYETGTGEGATNAANAFYQDILSGDPSKIAEVLAPEIKAGQDQVEQQAKQNAEFGNRSGGTNASTNAAQSKERGNIINLIGGLQQGAAGAEAGIGSDMLSQGSGNLSKEADLAIGNRQREVGDINGIAQGAAQIATGFMAPGAGAGDPFQTLYNAQHSDTSSLAPTEESLTAGIQ